MKFDAEQILIQAEVPPTLQRVAILTDLYENRTHTTIDEMLERLKAKFPKFTQRTIYNTLNLYVEKQLISGLTIDERCMRYDFNRQFHAHFRCRNCGRIWDFDTKNPKLKLPFAAKIDETQFYAFGICKECEKKLTNNN